MNLTQALQKLFGTSTITQGFGVLDVNGAPHNGVDIGLPANAPVYAAASGTVVANQGAQIAIQSSKGVIESYLHIVQADLPIGTYVNQGQQIGTVTAQTGLPYQAGTGYGPTVPGWSETMPYWATGPHLHFAIVSTVSDALSDSGGVNPLPYIQEFADGATNAISSAIPSETQSTPLQPGGGNVAQNTPSDASTNPVGHALGQFGNLMDSFFGGPKIPTSIPEAKADLTAGANNALSALWDSVGKWVVIAALLLFGGLIVLELFKTGDTVVVSK